MRLGKALVFLVLLAAGPAAAQDRVSVLRDVVVEPGESVNAVFCFFCGARVLGTVRGDVVTLWAGAEVAGVVEGDVMVIGGGIRVRAGATVHHDAVASAGIVQIDPGGAVAGESFSQTSLYLPGQRRGHWRGIAAFLLLNLFVALLSLAVLGIRLGRQVAGLRADRWQVPLVGLLLLGAVLGLYAAAEFLGAYAELWIIGVTSVWFLLWVGGYAGLCAWIGGRLMPWGNPVAAVAAGAVGVTLLALIPLAGLVVYAVAVLYSFGIAGWSGFGFRRGPLPSVSPMPPGSA